MMAWIAMGWQRYCHWLKRNGLDNSQCRSCVPLDERAQRALKRADD
ncbi:DUF5363 family protein [uncultured Ferrimonas sp.]|nr:DUF5363 family protein [uncultured Ferrimonas sp.]